MSLKPKVRILTSSHTAFDERIFYKQAKSIAIAGYDTAVIAPHKADEILDGIRIKAVPKSGGKILGKIFSRPLRVLAAGIKERADIYHLHDPELLPAGIILKLMGKRVIYDAHEYYRQNILSKRSLPWGLRHLIAYFFDRFETFASVLFDGVIVVDRSICAKFTREVAVVSNYPYAPKIPLPPKSRGDEFKCVYAGGLSADRGLFKMIEAMEYVNRPAKLILLGPLSDDDRKNAEKMKGYEKVEYLGLKPWPEVLKLLPECNLGLVLLQPVPAYILAGEGTVKLYEYMASGLPVLGSNFANLKRIITETRCGTVVDPTAPVLIADKIAYLADNPDTCRIMGENGVKAVTRDYNWDKEWQKLLALYSKILNSKRQRGHAHA